MNTRPRSSNIAERFGRWLGRGWRGYVRRERRVVAWLASVGVPSGAATALVWIVKLAVLGVLLYTAFWLALLLVCLLLVARGFGKGGDDFTPPGTELRHGEAGFGLYSSDRHRLDPHDPNNPYDD
ncbi:DUF3742 family protein [Alcaligenaceae bacterium]|nr:DUF3742 family protein [Alcaligenaceae bacterium]